MKIGSYLVALVSLVLAGASSQANAVVSQPSIFGVWSNPVVAGDIVDGLTNVPSFTNNNGTAVDTINGNTITWGSWLNLQNQQSCGDIAPTACFSSLTFSGNNIPAVQDAQHPFQLGTITFSNGSSTLTTLIFGATLTFFESNAPSTPVGSDFVFFGSTVNDGTTAQNADYITFSGLAGQSFNVLEGDTSVAGLTGYIDDVVLTGITAQDQNGFVGNSPAFVPEPASLALLGTALAGFGLIRRRRKTV